MSYEMAHAAEVLKRMLQSLSQEVREILAARPEVLARYQVVGGHGAVMGSTVAFLYYWISSIGCGSGVEEGSC